MGELRVGQLAILLRGAMLGTMLLAAETGAAFMLVPRTRLNENLISAERHISFALQGFALINAAIMAKVILIAEDLKLGRRFDHLPLIYPVACKSALSPSCS